MKTNKISSINFKLQLLAKIWSVFIIVFALMMFLGYAINYIQTGVADSYTQDDYPPIENLIPISLLCSVIGLVIAWQWECLGGFINIDLFF